MAVTMREQQSKQPIQPHPPEWTVTSELKSCNILAGIKPKQLRLVLSTESVNYEVFFTCKISLYYVYFIQDGDLLKIESYTTKEGLKGLSIAFPGATEAIMAGREEAAKETYQENVRRVCPNVR